MLARIKEAKPSVLYVACDGPREHVPEDKEKVRKIHDMVDSIDWRMNRKSNRSSNSPINYKYTNREL